MTYIQYLGTFFFSRYPSVALARNVIKINLFFSAFALSPCMRGAAASRTASRALATAVSRVQRCGRTLRVPTSSSG